MKIELRTLHKGEMFALSALLNTAFTGTAKQPDIYDMYIGESHTNTDESAKGYFEMILSQLEKKRKGFEIDNGTPNTEYTAAIEKIKQLLK